MWSIHNATMKTSNKLSKAHCNECARETTHRTLKSVSKDDFDSTVAFTTTHRMIECCGCGCICMQRIIDASILDRPEVDQYPPRTSRRRDAICNCTSESTPNEISHLLSEIYSALDSDNRRLATMGARAVLDLMIVDKVSDLGNFQQKLDALVAQDFITTKQRIFLDAALEIGNAAAHRAHIPTHIEINLLMNIVEGVLTQIYVLPEAGLKLKSKTPTRKRAKSKPAVE